MGKYFTVSELTYSSEAKKRKIDNTPPPDIKVKLNTLINNVLDPIREQWGGPINVNSGFRSPTLNRIVGGVYTSQHVKGEAADITVGSKEKNKELFDMIVGMSQAGAIQFDQLIDEKDYSWIHISHQFKNRNQILHL